MTDDSRITAVAQDEDLADLFHRAARLMSRAAHRRDRAHHAQEHVLMLVGRRGKISQRELMEMLGVRSASLSEVLAKLERQGLVTRDRDPDDRRGHTVDITQTGKAAAATMETDRREGAAALFACLDETERKTLAGLLHKLVASLEDDPLDLNRHAGRGRHGRHGPHGRHGEPDEKPCGHGPHHGFGPGRRGGPGHGGRFADRGAPQGPPGREDDRDKA